MSYREYQFTSTLNGDTIEFVLQIDIDEIARRLSQKVRKSKHGKAAAMLGAIRAKRIERAAKEGSR